MSVVTSREQFLQLLADAERLAVGLSQAAQGPQQQLLGVIVQHLAFAQATVAQGAFPTAQHKAALQLSAAAQHLAPGPRGENTDPATAWLRAALPAIESFYRALEPPQPAAPAAPPPAPVSAPASAPAAAPAIAESIQMYSWR